MLTLYSYVCLALKSYSFPSGSPIRIASALLIPSICVTCPFVFPSYPHNLLPAVMYYYSCKIYEAYQHIIVIFISFTLSLVYQNISFSTLLPKSFNPSSSVSLGDQVSQPYKLYVYLQLNQPTRCSNFSSLLLIV